MDLKDNYSVYDLSEISREVQFRILEWQIKRHWEIERDRLNWIVPEDFRTNEQNNDKERVGRRV